MALRIPFIKGHMGGNEIILLWGDIPQNRELEIGLAALRPPYSLGQELGSLHKTEKNGVLKVNITWKFFDDYIEMCGGLTQVLGKALVDVPQLADYFGIKITEPATMIALETKVGLIPVTVEVEKGKVKRVLTDMTYYAKQCYQEGVKPVEVAGVPAMKVGEFLVAKADDIVNKFPSVNLSKMDKDTLEILEQMQLDWQRKYFSGALSFTIYDLHPEHKGQARAVFPHDAANYYIEPSCGTGTVAAGIALIEQGEVKPVNGHVRIVFETGGKPVLGGPELSELVLKLEGGKLMRAEFSHNLIETLAVGELWLS